MKCNTAKNKFFLKKKQSKQYQASDTFTFTDFKMVKFFLRTGNHNLGIATPHLVSKSFYFTKSILDLQKVLKSRPL